MKTAIIEWNKFCLVCALLAAGVSACGDAARDESSTAPAVATSTAPAARTDDMPVKQQAAPVAATKMTKASARAVIEPASNSAVRGDVRITAMSGNLHIEGAFLGLEPGEHGIHIHEIGDCQASDASSAGGHFSPDSDPHGSPATPASAHHLGDLGNMTADENGNATLDFFDSEMTLDDGKYSIVGRAVVIHEKRDDLVSQPSGDAGTRVGCGVIVAETEMESGREPSSD